MERKELWKEVLDKLQQVGNHLNTVGNEDLNEEDYHFMQRIEIVLQGYRKTYK